MDELLYLVHRIPYPPNKGDKIRSYHLLQHLAQRFKVHVGAFIDDSNDWQYTEALAQMAGGEVKLLALNPRLATLKSAAGLLTGEPLTLPYYRARQMQRWVDDLLATRPITRALVYSSSMAQYVMQHTRLHRVIDFVDIDSDKWRQYAEKKTWPMNWVYRREARTLFDYERRVTHAFAASAFVSEAEAALFKRLAPDCADKVFGFSNGVDTDYFSPSLTFSSPYPAGEQVLVFTGAMDYWANVDAVTWFARDIFPAVKRAHPEAAFYIVGTRPTSEVQALVQHSGVTVTGAVADTRPYIAHAAMAVAPLRIARGIQNKILEAMAMAKPTVVTEQALEGIDAQAGRDLLLASDSAAFSAQCIALLTQPNPALGQAARNRVVTGYSWARHLASIDRALNAESVVSGINAETEMRGAA